nr:coatomer subunit delta-2-like [Tanacetum cinerariifolium]
DIHTTTDDLRGNIGVVEISETLEVKNDNAASSPASPLTKPTLTLLESKRKNRNRSTARKTTTPNSTSEAPNASTSNRHRRKSWISLKEIVKRNEKHRRVYSLGFTVYGLGFRVYGLRFTVYDLGLRGRVQGSRREGLTFINDNIIVMGFPTGDLSYGLFKRPLDSATKYKVYNLCSERLYDASLFAVKAERDIPEDFPKNPASVCQDIDTLNATTKWREPTNGQNDDYDQCPDMFRGDYCRLLSYILLPLYLQVIEDMEKLKQKLHEHIHEARHHLKLARELHRNLVVSECSIREHATSQRYIKIQEISEGGVACSLLHKKVRQLRASPVLVSKAYDSPLQPKMASFSYQSTPKESDATLVSESNVKNRELGNLEIRFKTHPNINKDLFSNENILGSKDPNRPFLASESGNGLPKWKMQSKDASFVSLTSKFLYVPVSMLDDGLILLEVTRWADHYRDMLEGVFGHGVKIDAFEQDREQMLPSCRKFSSNVITNKYITLDDALHEYWSKYVCEGSCRWYIPSCGKCSLCSLDLPDGCCFY